MIQSSFLHRTLYQNPDISIENYLITNTGDFEDIGHPADLAECLHFHTKTVSILRTVIINERIDIPCFDLFL